MTHRLAHFGIECRDNSFGDINQWTHSLIREQTTLYYHEYQNMWFLHLVFPITPFQTLDTLTTQLDQVIATHFLQHRSQVCARLLMDTPPFNLHPLAAQSWYSERSNSSVIQIWIVPFRQELPMFDTIRLSFVMIATPCENLAILNLNISNFGENDVIRITEKSKECIKGHLVHKAVERQSIFVLPGVLSTAKHTDPKNIIACTPLDITIVADSDSPTRKIFETDANGRYLYLPSCGSSFCPDDGWPSYMANAGVRVIATRTKVRSNLSHGFYMTACMFDRSVFELRTSSITYMTPLSDLRSHSSGKVRPDHFVGAHRCFYLLERDSQGVIIRADTLALANLTEKEAKLIRTGLKKGVVMGAGGNYSNQCIFDQSCTVLQYALALGIASFVETVCAMRIKLAPTHSLIRGVHVDKGDRTPWDLVFYKMRKQGPLKTRLLDRVGVLSATWMKWEKLRWPQMHYVRHMDVAIDDTTNIDASGAVPIMVAGNQSRKRKARVT